MVYIVSVLYVMMVLVYVFNVSVVVVCRARVAIILFKSRSSFATRSVWFLFFIEWFFFVFSVVFVIFNCVWIFVSFIVSEFGFVGEVSLVSSCITRFSSVLTLCLVFLDFFLYCVMMRDVKICCVSFGFDLYYCVCLLFLDGCCLFKLCCCYIYFVFWFYECGVFLF